MVTDEAPLSCRTAPCRLITSTCVHTALQTKWAMRQVRGGCERKRVQTHLGSSSKISQLFNLHLEKDHSAETVILFLLVEGAIYNPGQLYKEVWR